MDVAQAVTPTVSLLAPDPTWRPAPPDDRASTAFEDLHLEQVFAAVQRKRPEHDLRPILATRLTDPAAVAYRQQVFVDLARPEVAAAVDRFTTALHRARRIWDRDGDPDDSHERRSWHLHAGRTYVEATTALADDLATCELTSTGMRELRDHVDRLVGSDAFVELARDGEVVGDQLGAIRYRLHLSGSTIEVAPHDGAGDYLAEVSATLSALGLAPAHLETPDRRRAPGLDHLEVLVLDRVAQLHPEPFAALRAYVRDHPDPLDPTLDAFDRDVRFYLAVLEHLAPLQRFGLPTCTPTVTTDAPTLSARDVYDLALADRMATRGHRVVTNDLDVGDDERILVVSGANQGGKTTFARTVGQLLHLAAIGCPVPARSASLPLVDHVRAHFGRGEQVDDRRGRLQDDLVRVHAILDGAGPRSLIVANELFRSTTLADAAVLGRRILDRLLAQGSWAVYVTFVDELAEERPGVVSLVATVADDGQATRTFRVERRAADGRAYARAVAERHDLTYDRLHARLRDRGGPQPEPEAG